MIFQSMGKNSLLLAVFALITAFILASTDRLTQDRIAQSERLAAQKALFEIVPLERHNNDLLLDRFISMFGLSPYISKNRNIIMKLREYGKISA